MSIAAISYRGPAVENTHIAHVAVVDDTGRLVYGFGNPRRPTLPRSAAKPAQALAVLETGAFERFGLDDAALALCCASHAAEDRHLEVARHILDAAGAAESDLRCGGHPSGTESVYKRWIQAGFTPTAICSNCSGKHAGMLAGARALGLPLADYHLPEHPLQLRVRTTLASVCDLPDDAIVWGIDGCNLPTPSMALDRLALLYARLATARDDGTPRNAAMARIYRAMTTHPGLVAGQGRFCTDLMEAYEGTLLGKTGADGSFAVGVPAQGWGLAVKVEDGSSSVASAIVVECLHQLDIGTVAMRERLDKYRNPAIKNTMAVRTGHLETRFQLLAA